MGDPPFEYGAPRHDWNIEDIEWDQNEVRAELRASRSPDASAEASSAAQQVPLLFARCLHALHGCARVGGILIV